jgi:hypothetical protein
VAFAVPDVERACNGYERIVRAVERAVARSKM